MRCKTQTVIKKIIIKKSCKCQVSIIPVVIIIAFIIFIIIIVLYKTDNGYQKGVLSCKI